MKSKIIVLGIMFSMLGGCQKKADENSNNLIEIKADSVAGVPMDTLPKADNSKTSLDWDGVYTGTLPCADCGGIATELVLEKDKTYVLKMKYEGKKEGSVIEEKGSFSWDDTGSVITLSYPEKQPFSYKVGENYLIQLDAQGNTIEGKLASMYILNKKQ